MHEVNNSINNLTQVSFEFDGIALSIRKEKAVWMPALKVLLIADLHFGKAAHFRKSGIPIPEPIHDADLSQLNKLQEELQPTQTYFLGDLFHSDWNSQWDYFNVFLSRFPTTEFHLIKGNHDVLSPQAYHQSSLKIHNEPLSIGKILLSHEPMESIPTGHLNLCGHIHPGVRLLGKARQTVRIPCFHLSKSRLILPAFGNFTGLALVKPKDGDTIWGITPEKIIHILSGTSIG
ncbi:ligase-associated DNA damage response endonuclease PdeM [Algoriphagus boritolerans]|uniref:Putative phosphoesterase n=2 Tax=Algoriphagus TaxID=246875 RepID=A0A1H5XMW0_9BACT|nr:ligase-associated DNA damage response endonuclease PdeM [Algoriphagus boritolerans]SEG13078.1 putative phosphoesterase [Algoriphagus boritolerans DSM 17298 = JCM 18970]